MPSEQLVNLKERFGDAAELVVVVDGPAGAAAGHRSWSQPEKKLGNQCDSHLHT